MRQSVLIIGAGAAGLMAGAQLAKEGYKVVLVEATHRIGGRIHTNDDAFSFPVELGAEFIHGEQRETLALAHRLKLPYEKLSGKWIRIQNGWVRNMDEFADQWSAMIGKMNSLDKDLTLDEFLSLYFNDESFAGFRQYVLDFVEGYDAADSSKVCVFALRDEWSESDDETQYRFKDGYHSMVNGLRREIEEDNGEIHFDFVVHRLNWQASWVQAIDQSGNTVTAEACIVCVQVAVLQTGKLLFNPPLERHSKAFERFGNGGVIKFLFQFNKSFWDKLRGNSKFKDVSFVLSDAAIPTWWTQNPDDDKPLLTGWLAGPVSFNEDSRETLYTKAIDSLVYIFDMEKEFVQESLTHYEIVNWQTESNFFGAYAYATVESAEAKVVLHEPVENTVFFAGEYLYDGASMGTVEAALHSGKSAATRLIQTSKNHSAGI